METHTPAFSEDAWSQLQTLLFDKMGRYLQQRDIGPAFVWVRERERGKGPHTHVAVHMGRQPKRVVRDFKIYLTETLGFGPEGVDVSMGEHGAMTPATRAGIMKYLLKGIDHAAFRYTGVGVETENIAAALGIGHRGGQGEVTIKRAGTSQTLAIAARKQAGWVEIRDLAGLYRILNPPSNGRQKAA